MPHVTEFIYFQPKSSVEPENPSSDQGAALLQLFKATTQQSGHLGSAWGRTKEDKNVIVWAIGQYSIPTNASSGPIHKTIINHIKKMKQSPNE
jgi:hypothetical protein